MNRWFWLMTLASALVAISCSRSTIVADIGNGCDDIGCSGHGTCVMANAVPICMCEPGFHAEGADCIADAATTACAEIDCSGHGTCAVVNQTTAVCQCHAGYQSQGTSCVTGAGDEALLSLNPQWVTANAITWTWDAGALGADVHGYVLWYGVDRDEVAGRTGQATAWDVDDDPNLAWGVSPFGPNQVRRTTVSELLPETSYYAQLWVRRRDGPSLRAAEGNATTPAIPPGQVELFAETMPPGSRQAFEDTLASEAHTGSASLWYNGSGGWITATLSDLNADISDLDSVRWDGAYLEFFIRIELRRNTAAPIHYAELYLAPAGEDPFEFSVSQYVTLPNRATWHRIQTPLAAMERSGIPMTAAGLGDLLASFRIGFRTPEHRRVYVDDISIRY